MGTKQIHAEVIKAWADGEEIEVFVGDTWQPTVNPMWINSNSYRVKPKNIVVTRHLCYGVCGNVVMNFADAGEPNIKYEFTPEGKLVSVKMLK